MAKGRKYAVILSDEDRKAIEKTIRSKNTSRTTKCRAQILKLADA